MGKPVTAPDTKRRPDVVTALRLLSAVLAIVAVIKELRRPQEERTWHGALGGFVPYDMRTPTVEGYKSTLWNPDGTIVASRVFGVGWSINLGAIVAKLRSLRSTD
jgi:hypothetical protein